MLNSIWQQIWKTQPWPKDYKVSVFIPIPKKDNAKECSNYQIIALISHARKVILRILQVRFQLGVNQELPNVQITIIHWIIEKARTFQKNISVQFSSVQSLIHVWLFATPWTAACQASLSITNSQSLLKLMTIESVMPSNHLILCCPFLLLPSVFSSIRVFSNESVLHIRWPKYWSFSFSISPSSEYSGLISFRMN